MSIDETSNGLSTVEARQRLQRGGPNELPSADGRSPWRLLLEVLSEPMFLLIAVAAGVYLVLGEAADALLLGCFAGFSIGIAVIQESRTERVLQALRDLSSPRAKVLRDGEVQVIPGREVVPGDVVLVEPGDRVPADAIVLHHSGLRVNESLLSGESLTVSKRIHRASDGIHPKELGGDGTPFLYSGTLVETGSARARVMATGVQSAIGRIGESMQQIEREPPRLKTETARLVRLFAIFGLGTSLAVTIFHGYATHAWADAILAGVAVAMSMLPEEFPLVLTVFTAMGAWRISKAHVLMRKAAAIETLGAATVLCTDKTGTLTQNRMTVAHIRGHGNPWQEGQPMPPEVRHILVMAAMASSPDSQDAMDVATRARAGQCLNLADSRFALVNDWGLRQELLAVINVWRRGTHGDVLAAAKGAPEAIARLCGFDPRRHAELLAAVQAMAADGARVLAVAGTRLSNRDADQDPIHAPFEFHGLIGYLDPLRDSVPAAIRECREAGIRVVMITGDYATTACAIASQAGIGAGRHLTGAELASMDDAALHRAVPEVQVYARISPEQKLRIVEALKAHGEVVAMTGDGVNDAPSLKAAHIGIAMGARGTDVAREAASMVLLDDDFTAIVRAVRLGRRIYDNLRKTMTYILAVHVPIAGLALMPMVFPMPLLLTPPLIALLEIIIDPACSIVLEAEPEESNVMRRPPRDPRTRMLSGRLFAWAALQGLLGLALIGGSYLYSRRLGMSAEEAKSLLFVTLIGINLALILVNRNQGSSLLSALRGNRLVLLAVGSVSSLLAVILYWPPLTRLFDLAPPSSAILVAGAACSVLFLSLMLLFKHFAAEGR